MPNQGVREAAVGQRLAPAPEAMTLSYPALQGDALVIALNLWGHPSWSSAPQAEARPLPAAAELGASHNELSFLVPLSRETLGQRLGAALDTLPNEQGYRVSELQLLGPASTPGRWLWAARLSSEDDSALVYAESALRWRERA